MWTVTLKKKVHFSSHLQRDPGQEYHLSNRLTDYVLTNCPRKYKRRNFLVLAQPPKDAYTRNKHLSLFSRIKLQEALKDSCSVRELPPAEVGNFILVKCSPRRPAGCLAGKSQHLRSHCADGRGLHQRGSWLLLKGSPCLN